jgi:integrase/recombinase XerD
MTTDLITSTKDDPLLCHQTSGDEQLLVLWLHGRSVKTQQAYRSDAGRFFKFVHKELHQITLGDLQGFADSLQAGSMAPASRHRILSAMKSLFGFGHRIGYLAFDVARPLRLPPLRDRLSERILTEDQVLRMIALERHPRNHAIILLLYATGMRVSELCRLKWADFRQRTDGGQITVFGKGEKTNVILIPQCVWETMMSMERGSDEAPPFRSRKGGRLHTSQVWRIVKLAAKRADIDQAVSPH